VARPVGLLSFAAKSGALHSAIPVKVGIAQRDLSQSDMLGGGEGGSRAPQSAMPCVHTRVSLVMRPSASIRGSSLVCVHTSCAQRAPQAARQGGKGLLDRGARRRGGGGHRLATLKFLDQNSCDVGKSQQKQAGCPKCPTLSASPRSARQMADRTAVAARRRRWLDGGARFQRPAYMTHPPPHAEAGHSACKPTVNQELGEG
jgi:hypothetical protein